MYLTYVINIVVKLPSWNEKYLFYQVAVLKYQNIKVGATELFNFLIRICIANLFHFIQFNTDIDNYMDVIYDIQTKLYSLQNSF